MARHLLGNFRDPVKEIFYIVLFRPRQPNRITSRHTAADSPIQGLGANRTISFSRSLRMRWSCWIGIEESRPYQENLRSASRRFGGQARNALRKMPADVAYAYLCTLPGVGPKSALCVMMYSLGFDVFPVDAHVNRVLSRIGAIRLGAKHYQAQALLPSFIPNGHSKELHVALVLHGRQVCKPQDPLCGVCTIRHLCKTGQSKR